MQKQIRVNDKVLQYRVLGEGPPVLLIHGFGEDGDVWRYQVAALQNRFRLIVPDLPGSGASAFSEACGSIDAMASAMRELLDAEGVVQAAVLGHSMGGYIALAMTEFFPQRVGALGLVHSTAFADSDEKKAARRKGIEFIKTHGTALFLAQTIPNLFAPFYVSTNKSVVEELVARGNQFSANALIHYYEAMMARPDRTVFLRGAPMPVLWLMGVLDGAVPFSDSIKQAHLAAISYIHILKNAAHMGIWEEKDKVNGMLSEFLAAGSP
jgi:pimeloyl-ACP methyl ester carboxylesterase